MSYIKWGWEQSDVYIYGGSFDVGDNYIECCGCGLRGEFEFVRFTTYGDLLRHIEAHRADGDCVPTLVDDRIREEIANPDGHWIPIGEITTTWPETR